MIKKFIQYILRLLFKPIKKIENGTQLSIDFEKPNRKVSKVFIHCSGSDREEDQSLERLKFLHTFNKGCKTTWGRYGKINCKAWKYIGYHYYIEKDGIINRCRPLEVRPSAQEPYNSGTIAICVAGEKEFTEVQLLVLVDLCAEIHLAYDRITFWGHCDVSDKPCPNFPYREVLNLDDEGFMEVV